MTMNRNDVIAALASFASPLGPLTTLEERLERQDRWVDSAEPGLVAVLAGIVQSPPDPLPAIPDDWEVLLVEVAGKVAHAYPDEAITHFVPLLDLPLARAVATDILGSVGDTRAVTRLSGLLGMPELSDDERIRVVGALGEIGGPEAHRLLQDVKASTPSSHQELHRELDIALAASEH
jgi:hypothetical protein